MAGSNLRPKRYSNDSADGLEPLTSVTDLVSQELLRQNTSSSSDCTTQTQ